MQPRSILVVEDDAAIAHVVVLNLRHNAYSTRVAADIASALRLVDEALPDCIILDWMLPAHGNMSNGVALAKHWRAHERTRNIPILMLTARSEEQDRIAGLDAGADDYLSKPFSTQELLARIRALLRRGQHAVATGLWQLGDLVLDEQSHRVTWQTQSLHLSPNEYKLLLHFMHQPQRVHSRAQLLHHVWSEQADIEERTVDVHIKRLREALGEAAAGLIETVRGAGYRLNGKPQRVHRDQRSGGEDATH